MADYTIKLYDEELLSFTAEKFLDEIVISNIRENDSRRSVFPIDLEPTADSILHWLRADGSFRKIVHLSVRYCIRLAFSRTMC